MHRDDRVRFARSRGPHGLSASWLTLAMPVLVTARRTPSLMRLHAEPAAGNVTHGATDRRLRMQAAAPLRGSVAAFGCWVGAPRQSVRLPPFLLAALLPMLQSFKRKLGGAGGASAGSPRESLAAAAGDSTPRSDVMLPRRERRCAARAVGAEPPHALMYLGLRLALRSRAPLDCVRRTMASRELWHPAVKELPLLKDTPAIQRETLFKQKLELCSVVFDFTDASVNKRCARARRHPHVALVS